VVVAGQVHVERAPAVAGCDQLQQRMDAWQTAGYIGEREPNPPKAQDPRLAAARRRAYARAWQGLGPG
jgi:hypothetical protein